jgi:hypothetical protein
MDTRIEVPVRFRHDEETIRMAPTCGVSRNHKLCEMFIVGKWRVVGWYTHKQINRGKYIIDVGLKIQHNVSKNDPIHTVGYKLKTMEEQ